MIMPQARELIIALPESFTEYEPQQLLNVFTDYFINRTSSTTGNYTIFDFGLDVSVQLSNGALVIKPIL